MRTLPVVCLTTLVLFTSLGCKRPDKLERIIIFGEVTYEGKPVPFGSVWFEPTLSVGKMAPTGFAIIRDGQYRTKEKDAPLAGAHRVRISGYPEEAPRTDDEEQRIVLFPPYTTDIELASTKEPLNFEVPKQQQTRSDRQAKNR